jgi:AcrR family transcriptional regulator
MRERYRAQVRAEIKELALRQIAESGVGGLSVAAIGKELGVSGPALYRYFASRDDLLTALIIDAYDDLGDALQAVAQDSARRKPEARLEAVVRAYRDWALAQPHRYQLLFGPPLPTFDAHAQRLVDASQKATKVVADVLTELPDHPVKGMSRALSSQLSTWSRTRELGIDANVAYRDILIWSRVHGFVILELAGNFASMGIDSDRLFDTELANLMAILMA